jgi:anti-anti-sigma factor
MEMTRAVGSGWTELTITGRLDGYWADHLDQGLSETIREGHHRLRLHLDGVSFLSSAGIAVLVKYYKRLQAIRGTLQVGRASAPVRTVLEITRLAGMLIDETPPVAGGDETITGQALVRDALVLQVFALDMHARMTCRTLGAPVIRATVDGVAPASELLSCSEDTIALGVGAFGASEAECLERCGEFVSVGGAAAFLPTDGTDAPDYLIGSGALVPDLHVVSGLACTGRFAAFARFDVNPPERSATLATVITACLDIVGARAVAIVMMAEAEGLVGASLRRSPVSSSGSDLFRFPDVRRWLTFTAEPAFSRALALVVGVAQRGEGPVDGAALRPLDSATSGHLHAAAFPYHPFKKGRIEITEAISTIFEASGPMGVLHLLNDDRERNAAGESRFTRGACWIAPLEGPRS